jgi:mannose-6-phosphate isomerase
MEATVRRVEKPWGYELIFAETDRYVGKVLHIHAGQALSLQYHERKDETFFVAKGSMELIVEENGSLTTRRLTAGDSYRVVPPTRHRMIGGADGCELFEVSTPELDDVVRVEDLYGRAG